MHRPRLGWVKIKLFSFVLFKTQLPNLPRLQPQPKPSEPQSTMSYSRDTVSDTDSATNSPLVTRRSVGTPVALEQDVPVPSVSGSSGSGGSVANRLSGSIDTRSPVERDVRRLPNHNSPIGTVLRATVHGWHGLEWEDDEHADEEEGSEEWVRAMEMDARRRFELERLQRELGDVVEYETYRDAGFGTRPSHHARFLQNEMPRPASNPR